MADPPFDPEQAYTLHPAVAIRPEPFGALAYHYGNRRLTFLRSPDLVDARRRARAITTRSTPRSPRRTIDAERWPASDQALASLAEAEVLRAR